MAEDDFDLDGLTAYLHLDRMQITRLVERGKLPGRRVAGQWRFSQAEIHHWLEERIGVSGEEELMRMEDMLREEDTVEPVSIAALLPLEAVAIPLEARTRGSAITSMVELAERTHWLWDAAKMAEAVRAREAMVPTALENGVALLHPRRPLPNLLDRPFLALGRVDGGIPFGAPRGALTDLFFLILSIDDRGHLQVLARLSRLLNDPALVEGLRQAVDAVAALQVIADHEAQLA